MFISYLLRGVISSLVIFGVFERMHMISVRQSFKYSGLGALSYLLGGGWGYTFFLSISLLIIIIKSVMKPSEKHINITLQA